MIILFDYDNPSISGFYCLKTGLKYILFAFFKFFNLKPNIVKEVYDKSDEYAVSICKLNNLLGIETIVGIKEEIYDEKIDLIEKLKKMGIDVRVHRHYLEKGENRKRYWFPPLDVPKYLWNFETDILNGLNHQKECDFAVFHFDYPHHINIYIDYLYEEIRKSDS